MTTGRINQVAALVTSVVVSPAVRGPPATSSSCNKGFVVKRVDAVIAHVHEFHNCQDPTRCAGARADAVKDIGCSAESQALQHQHCGA